MTSNLLSPEVKGLWGHFETLKRSVECDCFQKIEFTISKRPLHILIQRCNCLIK